MRDIGYIFYLEVFLVNVLLFSFMLSELMIKSLPGQSLCQKWIVFLR